MSYIAIAFIMANFPIHPEDNSPRDANADESEPANAFFFRTAAIARYGGYQDKENERRPTSTPCNQRTFAL